MIRKQISLLAITFMLACISTGYGQLKTVNVKGKIDFSLLTKFKTNKFMVKVHDRFKKLISEEELIEVLVAPDRTYHFSIKPRDTTVYLSFWIQNKNQDQPGLKIDELYPIHHGLRNVPGLDEQYLFESGDSLEMLIGKEVLRFKGIRADKLNFQAGTYVIPNIKDVLSQRFNELSSGKEFGRYYELLDQCLEQNRTILKNLMQSYDRTSPQAILQQIYADALSRIAYIFFFNLAQPSDPTASRAMKAYLEKYLRQANFPDFNPTTLNKSAYYTEMSIYKAYRSLQFENGQTNFIEVFNQIDKEYTGLLRSQLILELVGMSNPESVKSNFGYVTQKGIDKKSLKTLKIWYDRQQTAFPFELTDADGKMHRLSDYKGKVIVIETWFTFCTACKQLNSAMHPIIERYKNNKDIVFLSVSTDQDREKWLKSVASGDYSSPHSINLYTSGLGFRHPLLKFYNFEGAPQQLIIDKRGRLVSSSPPRADSNSIVDGRNNAERFIAILEQSLR